MRKKCRGEKFRGRKVPGEKSSGGEKCVGRKVPGEKSSGGERFRGRKVCGEKSVWGEKFLGRKVPGEKSVSGRKVPGGERCVSHAALFEKKTKLHLDPDHELHQEVLFSQKNLICICKW